MKSSIAKRYPYFFSIRLQKDGLLLQIIILLSFYKRNIKCDFRTKSANLRKKGQKDWIKSIIILGSNKNIDYMS